MWRIATTSCRGGASQAGASLELASEPPEWLLFHDPRLPLCVRVPAKTDIEHARFVVFRED